MTESHAPVSTNVHSTLVFATRAMVERAAGRRRIVDLRRPSMEHADVERVGCAIRDARDARDLGLDQSGFELFSRPSAVRNWLDANEVMAVYYDECKALAREVTGATHAFTFDHLVREAGRQIAGGGIGRVGGAGVVTGPERGGGYVGGVHMDYTEDATWTDYLALHGVREPVNASRVVVLNFWRPLVEVVESNPLAVCDARTIVDADLAPATIFGYGPNSYSWHDIGISIYDVAASPLHRWYYYARMTRDEVLLMKTFDSRGVIGRCAPHASFANPLAPADAPPRRSIELRVLCYEVASNRH